MYFASRNYLIRGGHTRKNANNKSGRVQISCFIKYYLYRMGQKRSDFVNNCTFGFHLL